MVEVAERNAATMEKRVTRSVAAAARTDVSTLSMSDRMFNFSENVNREAVMEIGNLGLDGLY